MQVLRENGLEKPILGHQLEQRWPEIMGPTVARLTRSVLVEGGVLTVHISSPALRQQLFEQRSGLIRKLNDAIGGEAVTSVRILA